MDGSPIQRDGRWWHPLPDGAWALWDHDANAWLPVDYAPPPPPAPVPAPAPAAAPAGPALAGTVAAAMTVRQRPAREPVEPREPAPAPSRDDTWASVRVGARADASHVTPTSNGALAKKVVGALLVAALAVTGFKLAFLRDDGMPGRAEVSAAFAPVRGFRYASDVRGLEDQVRKAYEERAQGQFGALELRTLSARRGPGRAVVVIAAVDRDLAGDEIVEYASWVEAGAGMSSTPVDLAGVQGLELAGPQGSGGVIFVDSDGLMVTVAAPALTDARGIATQLAAANA